MPYKPMNKICELCGKEYKTRRPHQRFCSIGCNNAARKKRVSRICEHCGHHFDVPLHRIAVGRGRFCSRDCFAKWRTEHDARGQDNPFFHQIQRICEMCETLFWAKAHRVADGGARFCSNQCRGEWHSTIMKGEHNPRWKGGISFEPYPLEFNSIFREAVRERDNYTCAICRLPGKDVHHVNYIKDDTVMRNCITLCRPCHTTTNANRECWQVALGRLVGIRETTSVIYPLQQIGRY